MMRLTYWDHFLNWTKCFWLNEKKIRVTLYNFFDQFLLTECNTSCSIIQTDKQSLFTWHSTDHTPSSYLVYLFVFTNLFYFPPAWCVRWPRRITASTMTMERISLTVSTSQSGSWPHKTWTGWRSRLTPMTATSHCTSACGTLLAKLFIITLTRWGNVAG